MKGKTTLKVSLYAGSVMILFLFFGSTIFSIFNIKPAHFAVAGSSLIIFFGIKMMFGLHFDYLMNLWILSKKKGMEKIKRTNNSDLQSIYTNFKKYKESEEI